MVTAGKPITIEGVKITPKWAWSNDYLKLVRAQMRADSRDMQAFALRPSTRSMRYSIYGDLIDRRRDVVRAYEYALWLARRDDIDLSEARDWRPVYDSVENGTRRQSYWGGTRVVPRLDRRVRAIEFLDVNNHGRPPFLNGGGRTKPNRDYIEPDVVARIDIPNWDFIPAVEEIVVLDRAA